MLQRLISFIGLICIAASIFLAYQWANNPEGNYEPYIVLLGSTGVVLDIVRRVLRSSKLNIFLSVGATYTQEQEEYVKEFERFLADNNCTKLLVGRDCPVARQPIVQIKDLIKKSDAVIVLAFTRYVIKEGIEKPEANNNNHSESKIKNIKLPTIWNQLEAAMAFALNKPLLMIIEQGIKQEAMLKDRLEFRAITTNLDKNYFATEEFKKIFSDFSSIVRRRSWFKL